MAHINRKYIDKHWLTFIFRGALAIAFGGMALFTRNIDVSVEDGGSYTSLIFTSISIFLIFMGIIDSANALYNTTKKHGWINSIIDAAIDIIAALILLFLSNGDLTFQLIVLSVYVLISGIIDLFHSFLSTVDPTDRFIRIIAGCIGCIMAFVILNAGKFDISMFARFFGVYMLIVGVTSLIYGVHNRAQITEDNTARKEAASARSALKAVAKSTAKKTTKKTSAKSTKTLKKGKK